MGQSDDLDAAIDRAERHLNGLYLRRRTLNRQFEHRTGENGIQRLARLRRILDRA